MPNFMKIESGPDFFLLIWYGMTRMPFALGPHIRQSLNTPCYSEYITLIKLIACIGDQSPKPIRGQPLDVLYKIFNYGSTASTFWLCLVAMDGYILEISRRISVMRV